MIKLLFSSIFFLFYDTTVMIQLVVLVVFTDAAVYLIYTVL